jgi:hypothetical protein
MSEEPYFKWKGWKWTFTGIALSIGHAALWAVVWTLVTVAFQHFGILKR